MVSFCATENAFARKTLSLKLALGIWELTAWRPVDQRENYALERLRFLNYNKFLKLREDFDMIKKLLFHKSYFSLFPGLY